VGVKKPWPSLRVSLLRLAAVIVALSDLCCSSQAALAQTADSGAQVSKGESLEEVVVTARKHSEDVQTVPVSVSAISGEQLKEQSIRTITNLQSAAPGLIVQQGLDDPQSPSSSPCGVESRMTPRWRSMHRWA
jgi:iron complex outermembrane receptor protein